MSVLLESEFGTEETSEEFVVSQLVDEPVAERRTWGQWLRRIGTIVFIRPFQIASLVIILAILSAVPMLQIVTLGYLLESTGRITRSGRIRDGLFLLSQAGKIGMACVAAFLFCLPIQLMSNWAFAAELVNPGSNQPFVFRTIGMILVFLLAIHLAWVWFRGNTRWWSYFRPRPLEFSRNIIRAETWVDARDRLWDFVTSLQLPSLFWLGLRGMAGTLVWIVVPAALLVGSLRNGEDAGAVLIGLLSVLLMSIVLLYLPYLQVRFAAENRLRAMFEVGAVRHHFRASPLCFFVGLLATYLFAIPLYLLKIEATPEEVTWAPCIVMVAFLLPARLLTGFAMSRATRRRAAIGSSRTP